MPVEVMGFDVQEIKNKLKGLKGLKLQTSKGTAELTDKGLSWTDATQSEIPETSPSLTQTTTTSLFKHPLFVGAVLTIMGITLRKVFK